MLNAFICSKWLEEGNCPILPKFFMTRDFDFVGFGSHKAPGPKKHQFLSSLALFYSIFTRGARIYGLYCSRLSHFREFQVSKSHFLVLKFLHCWQPGEQGTIVIFTRKSIIWSNSNRKCQKNQLFDFYPYMAEFIR